MIVCPKQLQFILFLINNSIPRDLDNMNGKKNGKSFISFRDLVSVTCSNYDHEGDPSSTFPHLVDKATITNPHPRDRDV
jgi:hypothetical protein